VRPLYNVEGISSYLSSHVVQKLSKTHLTVSTIFIRISIRPNIHISSYFISEILQFSSLRNL